MKEAIKSIINNYKKQRRPQKTEKKQSELNKRRAIIGKQTESNKELKQSERKQRREKTIDEDIDLGRFFISKSFT